MVIIMNNPVVMDRTAVALSLLALVLFFSVICLDDGSGTHTNARTPLLSQSHSATGDSTEPSHECVSPDILVGTEYGGGGGQPGDVVLSELEAFEQPDSVVIFYDVGRVREDIPSGASAPNLLDDEKKSYVAIIPKNDQPIIILNNQNISIRKWSHSILLFNNSYIEAPSKLLI